MADVEGEQGEERGTQGNVGDEEGDPLVAFRYWHAYRWSVVKHVFCSLVNEQAEAMYRQVRQCMDNIQVSFPAHNLCAVNNSLCLFSFFNYFIY